MCFSIFGEEKEEKRPTVEQQIKKMYKEDGLPAEFLYKTIFVCKDALNMKTEKEVLPMLSNAFQSADEDTADRLRRYCFHTLLPILGWCDINKLKERAENV